MTAAWSWTWLRADGAAAATPVSPAFTSRFDAEVWLGQAWHGLAAQGIAAALLTRGGGGPVPADRVDLTVVPLLPGAPRT